MDYIFCARRVDGDRFGGRFGPARFLAVPMSGHTPLPLHDVPKAVWANQVHDIAGRGGDIVTLIHGLTLGSRDMLVRHRRFRQGLEAQGYKGVVISYDWPAVEGLVPGLCAAEGAVQAARVFWAEVRGVLGAGDALAPRVESHIVAHSTGCDVIRRAFDLAEAQGQEGLVRWSLGQVALVAADVAAAALAARNPASAALYLQSRRVANYFSHFDEVLRLSDTAHTAAGPRAGRIGLRSEQPGCAVDVHCGAFFDARRAQFDDTEAATHDWYFKEPAFYKDLLGMILDRTSRPPAKTRALEPLGMPEFVTIP